MIRHNIGHPNIQRECILGSESSWAKNILYFRYLLDFEKIQFAIFTKNEKPLVSTFTTTETDNNIWWFVSGMDRRGAGGPGTLEIRGFRKGAKSDFCFSEFSYYVQQAPLDLKSYLRSYMNFSKR